MVKNILFEGRFLSLVEHHGWEYVERPGASGVVMMVAVTDDQSIVLVEQFRRPLGKRVIELPAGLAGDEPGAPHEEMVTAAKRELLEETGYTATNWDFLFSGTSSPGLADEVLHVFRASGLRKEGPGGGVDSEDILVHEVPLDVAAAWLKDRAATGTVVDSKVYAGLFFASGINGPSRT